MVVNAVTSMSLIRHLLGSRAELDPLKRSNLWSARNSTSDVQHFSGLLCRGVMVIPIFGMLCNVLFVKLIVKLKPDGIQYR